ncbi:hypothetical protein [Vibrio sp. B1Z05]|uniref:hypothetical protein n=1 Tax=Vibrio sp. B1Z05 TaxID=2654980 RepID=UPI00128BA223|nr:hypothetical protein [Vibrio sp. B1Z05]MPW37638.1 hypothetical protein [Vibrio sp. B1Z05]
MIISSKTIEITAVDTKTRDVIRQWDNRLKNKSYRGTELAKQMIAIFGAWEAFRCAEATPSQQLIAYQVHEYLMGVGEVKSKPRVTNKIMKRNLNIHRVLECGDDRERSINYVCRLFAGMSSLGVDSVQSSYRNWKRDKGNVERALKYQPQFFWESIEEGVFLPL